MNYFDFPNIDFKMAPKSYFDLNSIYWTNVKSCQSVCYCTKLGWALFFQKCCVSRNNFFKKSPPYSRVY